MKKDLTDEQKKALGHVEYEHKMLKFTKEALVKCFSDPKKLTCNVLTASTASGTLMNLKEPKQKDLRDALDALLGNSSTNMKNLQKALLESFLVHFRNLYDFYYKKEGLRKDDLAAGYFFEWNISSVNEYWKSRRKDVNKRLSHLTQERIGKPEPKWKYEQMEKEIEKGKTIFSEKLRNEFGNVPEFWTSPKDGGVS